MNQYIFAYYVGSNSSNLKWLICASSIRSFGGHYATAPIYILTPLSTDKIPPKVIEELTALHVNLIKISIPKGISDDYFGDFVYAAQKTESFCRNKTQLIVWVGWNTMILNEPNAINIPLNKSIGYCPVHHANIGSILSQPIDQFWKRIYKLCGVKEEKIFPMRTQIDDMVLRPYFNAGLLVIRPENHLFQKWWVSFHKFIEDPVIISFFQSNVRYKIFYHQAILTGVILSEYPRDVLEELPFTYNYPLHLYESAPSHRKPQKLGELITTRFEEIKDLDLIGHFEPYANWLQKKGQK